MYTYMCACVCVCMCVMCVCECVFKSVAKKKNLARWQRRAEEPMTKVSRLESSTNAPNFRDPQCLLFLCDTKHNTQDTHVKQVRAT